MRSSKSTPPRWVSPAVALTSTTPASSMVSSDTSRVPAPRSKMSTFFSSLVPMAFLLSPYEMAAAVGSLTMRSTLRPAMAPASLVACLWESLKWAGTVITAFLTVAPVWASAISFILVSTIEVISSAESCFSWPLSVITIIGLSPGLATTLNGHSSISACTDGSENLLPINRFMSASREKNDNISQFFF
ncbi:hypothetical protein PVAP13_6KG396524 [Panicum virgatum]|uniref:Uncharacterized protein n=1 Tax=Panicum virgatum TaxID=38727 RepID=A0A8T0RJV0_PANVG|nr:hypothetical protein PVAP13_6KG396524 [Panicum virgatum]